MAAARDVRAWALGRGINVPKRGELPRALKEAWNATHPDDPLPIKEPRMLGWGHTDDTDGTRLAAQRRLGGLRRNGHVEAE